MWDALPKSNMRAHPLNRKSTDHGLIYYTENVRWHIFPHIKHFNMAKSLCIYSMMPLNIFDFLH